MSAFEPYAQLAMSLAIGLLIGLERGWSEREREEGTRVAGLRTFGMIGLTGGLCALLARTTGPWLVAVGLLGLAVLMAAAYNRFSKATGTFGTTTVVAALATFLLGALAVAGQMAAAASVTVVAALLLHMKLPLHAWLRRIEETDLTAGLRLLLISVVVLLVLPDRGYGPGGVLNPFEIWWMVVLISAISFAGYLAIKILGPNRGVGATALFGGLVSSTAATVSLARLSRRHQDLALGLAGGTILAATVMFGRMAGVAAVIAPVVLPHIAGPLAAMTFTGLVIAGLMLRHAPDRTGTPMTPGNPLQFRMALIFAAALALVLLVSHLLSSRFGDTGLYGLAAVSGLADVDAITLSAARLAREGLTAEIAGNAIVIAALANTAMKALLYASIAKRGGRLVLGAAGAVLASGSAALWASV